jgi:hypothetical protein
MSVYAGPEIVNDGLVLCLDAGNSRSYPGSGNTWFDLSGNNNHGNLLGFTGPGPNSTSGFDTVTKHMMFDRHSGADNLIVNNRVVIANSTSLNQCLVTNGVTISFWLKLTSVVCTAMTKWDGSWEIFYCNNLVWRTQGTGGNDGNSGLASSVYLNQFHQVTATHSGTERKFYINGELFFTNSNTVTTQNSTNSISIGAYANGNYATVGAIPCYSLYNRVLTAQEISQNFQALRGRFGI